MNLESYLKSSFWRAADEKGGVWVLEFGLIFINSQKVSTAGPIQSSKTIKSKPAVRYKINRLYINTTACRGPTVCDTLY